jgi:hypothetical protein
MIIVPQHVCPVCGEFLPHWCAPVITRWRDRFTGKRRIAITDRMEGTK